MKRFNVIFAGLMSFGVVFGMQGAMQKETVLPVILITKPSQVILDNINNANENKILFYFKKNPQLLTNAMSYWIRYAGKSKDTKQLAVKSLDILSKMSSEQQKGTFSIIKKSVNREGFNGFFADNLIKSALTSYDEKQFPKNFELQFSEEMKKDEILEQLKKQHAELKRLKENEKKASIEWLGERRKLLEQYLKLSPEDEIYQKDLEKVTAAIEKHEKRTILTQNINKYGQQLKNKPLKDKPSPELLEQYLQALEKAEQAYPNTERAETIKNLKIVLEKIRQKELLDQERALLPYPSLEKPSKLMQYLIGMDNSVAENDLEGAKTATKNLYDDRKTSYYAWAELYGKTDFTLEDILTKKEQTFKDAYIARIKPSDGDLYQLLPFILNQIYHYTNLSGLGDSATKVVKSNKQLCSEIFSHLGQKNQSLNPYIKLIDGIFQQESFSLESRQACLMLSLRMCCSVSRNCRVSYGSSYDAMKSDNASSIVAVIVSNYYRQQQERGANQEALVSDAVKSLTIVASLIPILSSDIDVSAIVDEDLKNYLSKVQQLKLIITYSSDTTAMLRRLEETISAEVKKRENEASAAVPKNPEGEVGDLEVSMLAHPTLSQTSINPGVPQIPFEETPPPTSSTSVANLNQESVTKPDPYSGHPVSAETPQIPNESPKPNSFHTQQQKATVKREIHLINERSNGEMRGSGQYDLSDSAKQVMICVINLANVIDYADDDDRKAIIELGKNNLLFQSLANNLHILGYDNGKKFREAVAELKKSIKELDIPLFPPKQSSGGVINPSNPSGGASTPQTSATPPPSTPQKPIPMTIKTGSNNSATPMTTQPTTPNTPAGEKVESKEQQQGWFSYYITSSVSSIWNGVKSIFNWLGSWIPRFGG